MSAFELTDRLEEEILSGQSDLIVCNYANGDMVGHTGSFDAAVKAVEALDQCLARVVDATLKSGGHCLITADHGTWSRWLILLQGKRISLDILAPFIYLVRVEGASMNPYAGMLATHR